MLPMIRWAVMQRTAGAWEQDADNAGIWKTAAYWQHSRALAGGGTLTCATDHYWGSAT